MVLPCLVSVFNSIGGSCLGWIGQRIQAEATLLTSYATNVETLRTKVKDLSDAIEEVQNRIEEAANSGATLVVPAVKTLLKGMASLEKEASKLIADDEQSSDSTCLMGLRPNLRACYLTSRSAKKAIDEADELLGRKNTLDRVVANVDYSECSGVTPIAEFEEFESRMLVSKKIMEALKDPSVNMVGVYGMGGAGKTTLAEKIGADLQRESTFSYVVLATVSEKQNQRDNNYEADLFNIQKQIAEGFKIQLQHETIRNRAIELDKQLQKKDKVLIILDDLWSGFELKDVGIPIGSVGRKFKILMTSRSEAVLLKEMNSTSNFGVDSLPLPDATILFDRMVGGQIKYSDWRHTAEQVVIQCGGIPIILVTIAKALRNEASESWEDALTQLKQFNGESIVKEPYKVIEVSYKFLKSKELQKLLVLCAQLNHRSIPMEGLLKYAMGLNLFNGCKKFKEVRNRLHRCLNDLKGCCLLQDGNEEGIIKMHDVVHKFVSFVASRDHGVFSVAVDGELEDWPSKDELEHLSSISLPFCDLHPNQMLPAAFDNSKLESFLMFRSKIDDSFQIPDNFFAGMRGLKLMDLTRISLSSILVSSFEVLVKLRTLCLDGCKLSDISVIGELPMLQALSLVGSSIVLVPKEIGKLGGTLKQLDLRGCRKLKRIAAGVIFRLTLLEDLRIGKSYKHWQRLEGNHKRNNIVTETNEAEMASMEEFKNLRHLIRLEIYIHDHAKMFPKDLVFKKLEAFIIRFGNPESWSSSVFISSTRALEVYKSTAVELDGGGSKALLTSAESLLLGNVMSCVSVSEMDSEGFPELKHLTLESNGIQYIVKNYNNCIFPKMETLKLSVMTKLEMICDYDHPLPVGSFENLRVIDVAECDILKDLLSSNLARCLLRLKELRVEDCGSMESIIVSKKSENEEEIQIGFTHQLRVLYLNDLPRLVSFYRFKQTERLPSCTPLFNKKIMFSKLERLELTEIEVEKIWDDHITITAEGTCWLQNLTSLKVSWCDNLSYLFTSSMVKSLAQLKTLHVTQCDSVEEIVATRDGEIEGERSFLFPKLESLELENLPKFKRFCHANLLECPSLQKLELTKCPLLNTFNGENESSLFSEKIVFPKLEVLDVNSLKIEKVWDFHHLSIAAEETTCWFQNLTSLYVGDCHNLSYVFISSMVKSLSQLQKLKVSGSNSMEEIVATREGEIEGERLFLFPKLESLELEYLPELKRFCHANLLECPSLQTLELKECPLLNAFNGENESSLFNEKIVFPNLEVLDLIDIKIEKLWDFHHLSIAAEEIICWFQNLTSLKVEKCDNLSYLLTSSMVKSLAKLKQLEVRDCKSIEEIVVLTAREIQLSFPKLDIIELEKLPNLKRFCEANLLECQLLQKLVIKECPELKTFMSANDSSSSDNSTTHFTKKVAFPNMEELIIVDCQSLTSICQASQASPVPTTLPQLKQLEIRNCNKIDFFGFNNTQLLNDALAKCISSLEYCHFLIRGLELKYQNQRVTLETIGLGFQIPPILFVFLKNLPKLDEVEVSSYSAITPLFPCELDHLAGAAGDDMDSQANTLLRIGHLRLTGLSNMKQIWSEPSPLKYYVIPEVLEVEECDSLVSLAPPSTTLFKNLTSLVVSECPMLIKIVASSSTAKSLANLKKLRVTECDSLEEIVGIDDQWDGLASSNAEYIVFEKLEVLHLQDLNSLTSFCSTPGCNFRFPSLNRVSMLNCPKMKFFSMGALSTPNLLSVEDEDEDEDETEAELTECPLLNAFNGENESSLFDEKIVFPKLEELNLIEMEIEKIWDLHRLLVAAEETARWFQNLTSLKVVKCDNLSYLFTSSMVKSLAKLKQLKVRDCKSIEEIVALTEIETTGETQLSFTKLDSIEVEELPNLKRFCEANLLECQLLRKLVIKECPELKTFMSASSTTHFTKKVAFPNMEELIIVDCQSLTSIFQVSHVPTTLQQLKRFEFQNYNKTGLFMNPFAQLIQFQLPSSFEYFHLQYQNQRVTLETIGLGFQIPPILFAFLKSLPKLDKVKVSSYSGTTPLFPCELDHLAGAVGDDMGSQANTLLRIGHLRLTDLSNMKQVWSEHSPLKYYAIPEVLEVDECDSLVSLAPPSTTLFKNLTALVVSKCPMLIKIVASSSTTKSLVNLEKLRVTECDSLEEIVGIDDQWDGLASNNDEYIVFENLKDLYLQDLNSLTSFCSTSGCNFRFPSLDRVSVLNCPKMKFFSMGALSTPNLLRVSEEDDHVYAFDDNDDDEDEERTGGRWEGDLNSTIRQLFEEKVAAMVEDEDEDEEVEDEDKIDVEY